MHATTHDRITVIDPADLPPGWQSRRWEYTSVSLAPARLETLHRDARWTVRYAVALSGDEPTVLLPLYRSKSPSISDCYHDPGRQFAEIPSAPSDARRWVLAGGAGDLAGGFLVLPEVGDSAESRVALARRAAEVAKGEGCSIAAFYVREPEVEPFLRAWGDAAITVNAGEAAEIPMPFGTLTEYLDSFSSHRRRRIRKDWRDFAALGLSSAFQPAREMFEEAAHLVVAQRARLGIPDHPRLAAYRLQRWSSAGQGRYLCFSVRGTNGRLLAATFGCDTGNTLDMYEIGLASDPEVRLAAYLESGYYAPIRYAVHAGCARIEIGIGAPAAKRLRGAVFTPVHSVCLIG